ncbi:M48 family metallopeptidase [Halopiger goleimassiliensis]|uniref:M48 family metallopeptidase n=1 Tax=Halopiger goleimassiliensis TaxID=1293048 RepID=UPI0006781EC6|nr:M48 family metalloprotease [Halopiger goleimassiliensis]
MNLGRRMRLSLAWRMLAALAVLAVVSLVVAATAILAGGLLAWLALLPVVYALETLLLPFSGGSYGLFWSVLTSPLRVAVVAGIPLLPILYYRPVRDEIRAFRAELGEAGAPATETHPELANRTRRLAQQADIPEPDTYVADRQRAESYAVGGRSNGTIIVTTGLVSALSGDELEAVLAHEISHLANGDSRITNLVLVPMLVAERVGSDDPPSRELLVRQPLGYLAHVGLWALLTAVTAVQRLCCQFGIATLSRGRELAADRGAAELTGSPGTLVSALETLSDRRSRPSEDKRTWAKSASVLDILPRDASASRGPFRTHPSTETRIAHLETLLREQVDGGRNAGAA